MSGLATPIAIAGMIGLAAWAMVLNHDQQLAGEVVAGLLGWMVHHVNESPSPTQPPETPK